MVRCLLRFFDAGLASVSLRRWASALVTVSLGASSTGCIFWNSAIHYRTAPSQGSAPICEAEREAASEEQFVGLALSGGGSRAAVYGAAVLEALWEHGLLDDVSYISSVSGGSFAASYFVANHPSCDALSSEAERDGCWREFFARFKETMRLDYVGATEQKQFTKFRWFSNTRRATSLADVLDSRFLDGKTFADLRSQASAPGGGKAPVLLLNAASFDEGRRFVFSNMCLPDPPPAPSGGASSRDDDPLSHQSLRSLSFARPGCSQPTPGEIPVSLAVATSAAFPFVMGPVTVEMPTSCDGGEPEYWHLGDGGIIDNKGIDTLEEVMLRERRRTNGKLRKVLLLTADSGKAADPDGLKRIEDFWLSYHPGRLVDLSGDRAKGYHELYWKKHERELVSDGVWFDRITMRYTNAELESWPASCAEEAREAAGRPLRDAIAQQVALVPTYLKISECNADLMEAAAQATVRASLSGRKLQRLRGAGFSVRGAAN